MCGHKSSYSWLIQWCWGPGYWLLYLLLRKQVQHRNDKLTRATQWRRVWGCSHHTSGAWRKPAGEKWLAKSNDFRLFLLGTCGNSCYHGICYAQSSSHATRGVVRSCHSWTSLSFLVFVLMRHTYNETPNYIWAKFSWSYSRLAPRSVAVCRLYFMWKWDDLRLKTTCKLEFNVKSRFSLVSPDSYFEIWDHFDAEIQIKTQGAETREIQANLKEKI